MDKSELLTKFLKKHPEFNRYSPSRLDRSLIREKRLEEKLKVLEQIAELKFKNKKTVRTIARTIGISAKMVHAKIEKYLR
jgi:hypothetical protein